jgi:hypothetical protein
MDGEMRRPKSNQPAGSTKLSTSRRTASSPFPERARRVSATAIILLALWGGGFGCLWCCASDLPEGCCDKRSAVMARHAPACSAHRRCCEPRGGNQHAAIQQSSQPAAAHCCPLGARSNGPAAFPSSQYRQALTVAINEPPAPVSFTVDAPPLIADVPPANKGSTYLRCCVLLI